MSKGFTLIELMVVLSIIGVLMALTLTGIGSSRIVARDATRKADLELIRGGLEIYKADCNSYPAASYTTDIVGGLPLQGIGTPTACATENYYISAIPDDPVTSRYYRYAPTATGYEICAALEKGSGAVTCGGSPNCGTTSLCNYKVTNP